MRLNNNSANFHKNSHSRKEMPTISSKANSLLSSSSSPSKQSESTFDVSQSAGTSDIGFTQQLVTLVSLIKTLLESMIQSASTDKTPVADSTQSASGCRGNHASGSSGHNTVNPFTNVTETESDNNSVTGDTGTVSNLQSNLPAINSNDWSTRDGKNGEEFATPFVSKNVIKNGNSITTQLKGNEGAEATLDKKIGTGFYQFNVNPKLSSQVGDIPTVFFYSR